MSVDEILKHLVQRTEETGGGNSITLSLHGIIVTGTMIRSKVYYETISTVLDKRRKVLNKDRYFNKRWKDYKDEYKSFIEALKKKADDNIQTHENENLHLEDVKLWQSSTSYALPLWRCKLSAIDGFSFGSSL